MDHPNLCHYEAERPYVNRRNIMPQLDDITFARLNPGGHALGLNGYCLDALDEIPAGSMTSICGRPAQKYIARGFDAAEIEQRETLAERLIAELLTA